MCKQGPSGPMTSFFWNTLTLQSIVRKKQSPAKGAVKILALFSTSQERWVHYFRIHQWPSPHLSLKTIIITHIVGFIILKTLTIWQSYPKDVGKPVHKSPMSSENYRVVKMVIVVRNEAPKIKRREIMKKNNVVHDFFMSYLIIVVK